MADEVTDVSNKEIKTFSCSPLCRLFREYIREEFSGVHHCWEETTGNAIKELITNSVRDLGLTMDNCVGQSYDGAGNMAGRYAGVLTLIQHQFPKFILLLDKFLLVETSHTNCWIHPCESLCYCHFCISPTSVCLHNKKERCTLARWYEFYVLVAKAISRSFAARSLVRYCSCHSNIKFISSRHRVISSIYTLGLKNPDLRRRILW